MTDTPTTPRNGRQSSRPASAEDALIEAMSNSRLFVAGETKRGPVEPGPPPKRGRPSSGKPKKESKPVGRPRGRSYTNMISIKLTDGERRLLDWICDKHGCGISDLMRNWMNREKTELEVVLKEKLDET